MNIRFFTYFSWLELASKLARGIILPVLIASAACAMEGDANEEVPREKASDAWFLKHSDLPVGLLSKEITLLKLDEPITDELLLELNPQWQSVKETISDDRKVHTWYLIESYDLTKPSRYPLTRTLAALAVYVGTNPKKLGQCMHRIVEVAMRRQDFYLVKYLLEKGASPKPFYHFAPLFKAQSVALAKLLIDHGAPLDGNLFRVCCFGEYSFDLMPFYYDLGVRPCELIDNSSSNEAAFHILLRPTHSTALEEEQIKKIQFLLHKGVSASARDSNNRTVFHLIAVENNRKVCSVFIDHFMEQHAIFWELLMQFRRNSPRFYGQKDMLRLCVRECGISGISELKRLLNEKDNLNRRPFDIWPIEELNPANCSYKKLKSIGK